MNQIKLTVPCLVQNLKIEGQLQYLVRPVFFQQPQVSARSLENALQQFRQQLRKSLSYEQISPNNIEKVFDIIGFNTCKATMRIVRNKTAISCLMLLVRS